jgi:hypothetical protein
MDAAAGGLQPDGRAGNTVVEGAIFVETPSHTVGSENCATRATDPLKNGRVIHHVILQSRGNRRGLPAMPQVVSRDGQAAFAACEYCTYWIVD